MNLGLDTIRELLEDFLGDSGGRRGRRREQRRQQRDDDDVDGGVNGERATDADAEEVEADADVEAESGGGSGGLFNRGSNADEEDVEDLQYRIEELEEELEDKESELGTIQDSQRHVSEQVEEMNDTVRQLLGIYDQLTDDVNPFTGDGEEEGGFGVFGNDLDEGAETPDVTVGTGGSAAADDETISFDDLKGVIEDAAEARAAQGDGGQTIEFDERETGSEPRGGLGGDDDTRVEVQATESVDDPEPETEGDETSDGDDASGVTLETLADSYATDILVFEWLTQLVRTAGPAATLRAISYYAEIGWIDDEVRAQLEAVLSGPDLDIHVDPGRTPDELTAEDHADSYTYIMKLNEIHETKREVDP